MTCKYWLFLEFAGLRHFQQTPYRKHCSVLCKPEIGLVWDHHGSFFARTVADTTKMQKIRHAFGKNLVTPVLIENYDLGLRNVFRRAYGVQLGVSVMMPFYKQLLKVLLKSNACSLQGGQSFCTLYSLKIQ
jgi:hypothetical protein